MKKIIIPIGALLIAHSAHAQLTQGENYVYSKSYLDYNAGGQPTKTSEIVQYFDGLGRPKQVVNVKASPLGRDVVSHIEYDQYGRQTKDYLLVPQSGTVNGAIIPTPLANATQPDLYGSEKIFSEKVLENSPLDRILEQKQVGNAWSSKQVKLGYDAVTVADRVRKFITVTSWENGATKSRLEENWLYTDGQLYKNSVKDEDGNETIEFKNGKGQTVLVRKVIANDEYADTNYVYNEYNQLAFVIPPLASIRGDIVPNTLKQDELCYQYRYDGKGRLVEKKLPGKGWEYMVYDKADRLLLTQDAVMASQNKWLMTKYDMFGRVAYTGIVNNNNSSRNTLQSQIADLVIYDARHPTGFVRNGITVYYTSVYLNVDTLLSVNYYDSYPQGYDFNPTFPPSIQGEPLLTETPSADGRSTKGLPVMSLVKNIEDDRWTRNYTYYDTKGRPIGTYSINHLGGYTKTESKLDFAGVLLMTNTYHVRKPGESGITVKERFVYDHQNRLKEHYHQVDDKPEQLLAENTYNELSQLKNKKVGNNLQSIDYAYNIRGWMTDINKDQMSVPDLGGKLFSYKIKYNQKEGITQPNGSIFNGKEVKAKYNGNIAEVDWRSVESLGANPSLTPKRYGYAYDTLNRLTAGYYQNPQNPYSKEHTESLTYDMNGNISKLYRTAGTENTVTAVIDDLDYTYAAGNQVSKITDNGNSAGYEGGGGEIKYDLNGNMWKMADKNISKIQYNHLNLPTQIDYGEMGIMGSYQYIYRADGTKVQKIALRSECGIMNCYGVSNISDYLDGFQYMSSATINNGGGGDTELSRSFAQETSRAMEIQAFSVEEKKTIPPTKTKDLSFFPTAEGFYDYAKDQYIYQYKDHLGNVRISFGRNSAGALEITDANDYYPFGMNHLKTGNAFFGQNTYKNYKYNGKELQETGIYDYGWRSYIPDIGRWIQIDPLGEKGHNFSPYNYAINNPIRFIDPDGLWISITDGQNQYRYSNGQTQHQVDGKWEAIDKNVKLSDNVIGIVAGLQALENGGDVGKDLVSYFDNDKNDVNIVYEKGNAGDAGINLSDPLKIDPKARAQTPTATALIDSPFFISLGHELGHKKDKNKYTGNGWFGVSRGEIFASHVENMIRAENGLPLRTSYSINPKAFGGLDMQTVLIDCVGNSFYYQSANGVFQYNGRNGNEADDRANASKSVYGSADSSVLKRRYNYYDNVKHTKKK